MEGNREERKRQKGWKRFFCGRFLTRSLPRGIFTDSHPGGQHFWQCCFRFWRKGWVFHCQTNSKCNTTWSKSNVIQTYDGAKVTVFVRFQSESKAPGAVTCTALVPAPTSKFLQAQRPSTKHKKQRWWRWRFFFLPSRVFQVYDCYFTNVLTQRSCFEVLLTADSQCFTRNDARIFVPTIPRRKRAFTRVGTPRSSFTASSVVNYFSPGAPVTSFLCQAISSSTAIPVVLAFNKTKPALSSIAVVSKAFKGTARTSLCRIWEHPKRCFPPFGQKPGEA